MSAEKPKPPATHRGRSLAGFRTAANMTPEERSERARVAATKRWALEDERRAAAGLAPLKRRPPEPSAEELEPWLELVDQKWPDRQWPNREARRRQAIILLRTETAELAAEAMKRRES
jgi:hypothetical protein